jgi:hypothetical protein
MTERTIYAEQNEVEERRYRSEGGGPAEDSEGVD